MMLCESYKQQHAGAVNTWLAAGGIAMPSMLLAAVWVGWPLKDGNISNFTESTITTRPW
jgi:hypothetical protein